MIKRDFHGWDSVSAFQEVHNIVGDIRRHNTQEQAEFITGNGVIKTGILSILEQTYKLSPEVQWGNDGVIVVTIE